MSVYDMLQMRRQNRGSVKMVIKCIIGQVVILGLFITVFLFVTLLSEHRTKTVNMTIMESQKLTKELYESRLETLQLYSKPEQRQIINLALMYRKELKDYLIERFKINENDTNTELKAAAAQEIHHIVSNESRLVALKKRTKYLLNTAYNCTSRLPYLLIVVHSHASKRAQRTRIRQTWAGITSYKGNTIRTVFLLGKQADDEMESTERMIARERRQYDDVVLGDFVDTYHNLTIKHLMAYHWILTNCHQATYVVKVDDDVIVNVFQLLNFLTSTNNTLTWDKNAIYCSAFKNQGPRRDRRDKWYVSTLEYPYEKYPTYCEGFAYITTPEAVFSIYNISLHTKPFWIDDVFVTGILAKAARIRHIQFPINFGYVTTDFGVPGTHLLNNLFFLQKYNKDADTWAKVWQTILEQHKSEVFTTNSRYLSLKSPGRT